MLIQDIVKILTDSGIEPNEAKVEVKLLIEHFAGYSLVYILMGKKLTEDKLKIVEEKAKLRAKTHEPIQYIIGLADFMGEKFVVSKDVLIPRDETELLVRQAIEIINKNNFTSALDMCTGSGCIACMIAKLTNCQVMGVDISTEAIHTAFKNMEKFELFNKAIFRKSDIYNKIREDERFDIIVSNPPYIASQDVNNLEREVKDYDPVLALDGGVDGLEFYKIIAKESPRFLNKDGVLILEIGFNQYRDVEQLLKLNNFDTILVKDYSGNDRIVIAKQNKKEN